MNLIPLRTAAIAGTCAVALSFVALPAYAVTATDSSDTPGTSQTPTDDTTTLPTDDTTTVPTDDSTTSTDDSTTGTDDSSTDDSTTGTDDSDSSNVSDDNGSDSTDDSGDTTTAPVVLPAEKGKPKQSFAQTVFTPKQIAKKGLKVQYTGLTAGATYQPYESTGQSGGELGNAKTASKKGTITLTYKFGKDEKSFTALGATYTIGLLGEDTDLRLTQTVTVKYDSDLHWNAAVRHGKKVTLSVSVDKDNAAGKSSDWKKIPVEFQKKVGTKWVTVKTVKTNSKGAAKVTIKAGVATWRAVLAGSTTVIGATSAGHKK